MGCDTSGTTGDAPEYHRPSGCPAPPDWALGLSVWYHILHSTLSTGLVQEFISFNRYKESHGCGGSAGNRPALPSPPR